jgi:hypothetical protein
MPIRSLGMPILPLLLMLSACNRPPELRWTTDDTATVTVEAGPKYDSSSWWGCSWSNICPSKTWTWCLHIIPRTTEKAWEMYEEQHATELGTLRNYRERLLAPPYYEVYRADLAGMPDAAARTQAVEALKQVELDVEANQKGDADRMAQILASMQGGARYLGSYGITRAGKSNEKRSWDLVRDTSDQCRRMLDDD